MKLVVFLAAILALSGCNQPFADMPDNELADKVYECTASTDQSPGFAIRCDNLTRECSRRRDEGAFCVLKRLKWPVLAIFIILVPLQSLGIVAERPIPGGLGVNFGEPVDTARLGSTLEREFALPNNRKVRLPDAVPGQVQPWRIFLDPNLPRPFRQHTEQSFIMVNAMNHPMRVITEIEYTGCGAEYEWLKNTLKKKYDVLGEFVVPAALGEDSGYEEAIRVTFSKNQIDVRCGKNLVIEYGSYSALDLWAKNARQAAMLYDREQRAIEKRRIVLERRRAIHFADTFTLGDQYRLAGAFGIAFKQPFAANSTQQFPIDRPFVAVLPTMPDGFESGEVALEISPDRVPILIRGTFIDLEFERVADALKAKFGTPMKATDRHVIHKVGTNRAILKRLNSLQVELAFIDTDAKAEQRQRLWEQESEGL